MKGVLIGFILEVGRYDYVTMAGRLKQRDKRTSFDNLAYLVLAIYEPKPLFSNKNIAESTFTFCI